MPLYEYICDHCQCKFELLRNFNQADDLVVCPRCQNQGARRLISSFAAMSKNSDGSTTSVAGSSCTACSATSCTSCMK